MKSILAITKIKATLLKRLTKVKRNQFRKTAIKRILILRYDRIGDMIVSLPICKALKQGMPNAEITLVASKTNACVVETCNFIDKVVVKPPSFLRWLLLLTRLRHANYDIAVDLNHAVTPHTIFAIRILKPKHVATPFKDGRWGVKGSELEMFDLMPPQHPMKYERPISEIYLDIARLLNCPIENCLPYPLHRYPPPHEATQDYAVLNYTGSRKTMRLTDSDLKLIIKHIHSLDRTCRAVIPAMLEDYERLLYQFKDERLVDVLHPSPTIAPLLPIIQHAQFVITPDTALVHIASAYEVPLIAVFSNEMTLFQQWRPYPHIKASVIHSTEPKGLSGYSLNELLSKIEDIMRSRIQSN